jgi:hypothetical protein
LRIEGCLVVSVWDPYGCNFYFLDRSCYFFFQVAPQLYSRGWVDPVADPLLVRKSGNAGNWTLTSGSEARNFDHYTRGGLNLLYYIKKCYFNPQVTKIYYLP